MSAPEPTDLTVREWTPADSGGIIALWAKTFGDSVDFIRDFLAFLPRTGSCFAAVADGGIASMAFLLNGAELVSPGGSRRRFGYLYAVATDEKYRDLGLAGRVCRAAADRAKRSGCACIATSPAEPWLYSFYARRIGTGTCEKREIAVVDAAEADMKILTPPPSEYVRARENALAGSVHFAFSADFLALQGLLGKHYGGGLYLCGGCLCAGYPEDGILKLSECFPAGPDADAGKSAAALASALGCRCAEFPLSAGSGEDYLAHSGSESFAPALWAFTLG